MYLHMHALSSEIVADWQEDITRPSGFTLLVVAAVGVAT